MLSFDKIKSYLARGLGVSVEALEKSCRPATENDLSEILCLRRKVLGSVGWDDEKYLQWRFFDNTNKVNGEVPYWIFTKEDAIIGGLGLENIEILHKGDIHPAVRCFDIMVHPDYEGRGIGVLLNIIILSRFETTIVVDTNRKSTNLVSKLYHEMEDLQTYVLVGKTESILSKHLHLGFLAGLASVLPDALLRIKRLTKYRRIPNDLKFKTVEQFDVTADWTSLANAISEKIFQRRDAHRLNWRFLDNPRKTYRALGVYCDMKMVGYIVFSLEPEKEGKVREGRISDWMCIDTPVVGRKELMELLFQEVSNSLIEDGADILRCLTCDPDTRDGLIKNGFFLRPQENRKFFVQSSNPDLKKILTKPGRWFVNGFDIDAD